MLERPVTERMKEKGGGEGGEYKKGTGSLSFPSRVGEGNEGLWAQVDPTDDITASSSLLLFFPFPLSVRPSSISMVHACAAVQSHRTKEPRQQ